ncbi:MAG TPA: metallophosphoesterase [Candidatus Latescibacteria bacterium]|nr:metallophosphoesterase [Candidatus Latescibacterota bacterium]
MKHPFLVSLLLLACSISVNAQAVEDDALLLPDRVRSNPDKFTFAILGDRTGSDRQSWHIFDRSVEEINLSRPDFVIMVGDMIDGHDYPEEVAAQWEEFQSHVDRLEAPFMFLPGNHDVGTPAGAEYWKKNLGRRYTVFLHRRTLFLLLNTEEIQGEPGNRFGHEQVEFALRALDQHADVRHTFVFMHQPAWALPSFAVEWERIEKALGDRPYTVFCGHLHSLSVEERNGHRYYSLGPSGARVDNSPFDESAPFHHYTLVTLDAGADGRDSAHVSVRQPGAVWRPAELTGRAAPSVRVAARPGRRPGHPRNQSVVGVSVPNPFGEKLDATVHFSGLLPDGWQLASGDTTRFTVQPGETVDREFRFTRPRDRLLPLPYAVIQREYRGNLLPTVRQVLPLVPDSVFRPVTEWHVAGVFSPDADSATVIALTTGRPLEGSSNASRVDWRTASVADGLLSFDRLFGLRDSSVAYATCAVFSPREHTTLARIRANDRADLFINGARANEQPFRLTSGDSDYALVPLRAGWNLLVVRVGNLTGRWALSMQIANPEADLRLAAETQGCRKFSTALLTTSPYACILMVHEGAHFSPHHLLYLRKIRPMRSAGGFPV